MGQRLHDPTSGVRPRGLSHLPPTGAKSMVRHRGHHLVCVPDMLVCLCMCDYVYVRMCMCLHARECSCALL